MYIRSLTAHLLRILLPLAFCSTFYLYLYPIFHGCAFPSTDASIATALQDTFRQHGWLYTTDHAALPSSLAPLRLLVLADPQLEGDSSLPKPEDAFHRRFLGHWNAIRAAPTEHLLATSREELQEILHRDIPGGLKALRKRVDLFGNDYYLAHIYRTLYWWAGPTHVTVLGDLIGSQWVTDEEFEWRGWRFWNRVFAGGHRVEDDLTVQHKGDTSNLMNMSDEAWKRRVINVAGNHDIGYAGDISEKRLARFERVFGKANWDIRFTYPDAGNATNTSPTIHMVVLNTLNLDNPAFSEPLQREGHDFINSVITKRSLPVEDRSSFTLLLTHLPLHKKAGVCVDAPHFDYWGDDDGGGVYRPHGVKEQNHLSKHASQKGLLEGLFGMSGDPNVPAAGRGRNGLILTGHDHEGCDVWHFASRQEMPSKEGEDEDHKAETVWDAIRWPEANPESTQIGLREVTLRSMMGDFGGNAGLLSAWFDLDQGEWKYDIQMCKIGVQHLWWAIHIFDCVTVILGLSLALTILPPLARRETVNEQPSRKSRRLKED